MSQSFIVLDIETGGLSPERNVLLSIGAVDYRTGDEFYIESRAIWQSQLDPKPLAVNGFTMEQALDDSKPTPIEAYLRFQQWAEGRPSLLAGQQVGSFDILFLRAIHQSIDRLVKGEGSPPVPATVDGFLPWQFGHRSIDLHSISFSRFGESMSLDDILKACGLAPEPKPHNALTGARLERDAFKVLLGTTPTA